MSRQNSHGNDIEIDKNGNLLYPVKLTPEKVGISNRISREMLQHLSNNLLHDDLIRAYNEGTMQSGDMERVARILGVERENSTHTPITMGVDVGTTGDRTVITTASNSSDGTIQIHHNGEPTTSSNLGDLF